MQEKSVKTNEYGDIVVSLESTVHRDILIARMAQLLPILEAVATSDEIVLTKAEQLVGNRRKAVMAIDMLFSESLLVAEKNAKAIGKVAVGSFNASQFGFPEFDDGVNEGIAD